MGEHAWDVCIRSGGDWALLCERTGRVPFRRTFCGTLDGKATVAVVAHIPVFHSGPARHTVWIAARRVSCGDCNGTAIQYCQYPGMAATFVRVGCGEVSSSLGTHHVSCSCPAPGEVQAAR